MRWTNTPARFLRDQTGATLVYVLLVVPVMIGVLGLSLDLQRAFTLNTELQDLADAAAIAGARELDGEPDAIERARQAAKSVVQNSPIAATAFAGAQIVDSGILFFQQNCSTAVTSDADDLIAKCIRVWTVPRNAPSIFIDALEAIGDVTTAAGATARNVQVACQVTPMMMCIPGSYSIFQPGYLFELKSGTQLGPGAFALLDPPGLTSSGNNITRELLAATEPGFCFVNTASVATGNRTSSLTQGLNARFDMYPSGAVGDELEPYPPAPNVTKGWEFKASGPNCNFSQVNWQTQTTELMPFPLDACFINGGCNTLGGNRIGAGDWNRDAYWNRNHAQKSPAPSKPTGYSTMTRFQVYLWELGVTDEYQTPAATPPNLPAIAGSKEKAAPLCGPLVGAATGGLPTRRVVYVAVADCSVLNGNNTPNLQSARYAKFFLTHPSVSGEVMAEFVDWIEINDDSAILRQIVELIDYPNIDGVASAQ